MRKTLVSNLVLRLPHSGLRPFVRFGHTRHRRLAR